MPKIVGDRQEQPTGGFSAWSRKVAWAATEALLCDEDEQGALVPASPEVCERAVGGLDRSLGACSPELRRGFWVLCLLLEVLPLLVIGVFGRMSKLRLDRRLAYLEALEASRFGPFSILLVAFKVPLCIPAFEEGDELALTGFDRATLASRRKLNVLAEASDAARSAA